MFNYVLGLKTIEDQTMKVNNRDAVRAVIIKGRKILMVFTNKGDYKFPGGGIKKGETHEDAIIREVKEEVGYTVNKIDSKIGEIVERKIDEYDENSIFQMTSHYYIAEVGAEESEQNLDEYEAELDFKAKWVSIEDAIKNNEENLKLEDINPWVYRETMALKELDNVAK